jgi:hypothetical protein
VQSTVWAKGKVERGVGSVQDNAVKGRTFASLDEQNQFLAAWEQNVADTRIHGTTRRHVGQVFREVERPALGPLPAGRFPCLPGGGVIQAPARRFPGSPTSPARGVRRPDRPAARPRQ